MGFNWKMAAIGILGLIGLQALVPGPLYPLLVLLLIVLLILPNRVARHNVRQAFRRDGHQWVGDGPQCEECHDRGE